MTEHNNISSPTRRRFLAQSAAVVGAASGIEAILAACSGPAVGSSGPVTLTIMDDANDNNDTGLSKHWISVFQKQNPNIVIKRIDYDVSRLSAMLASNSAPDIVKTPGGSEITNLAARGVALDLTNYFKQSTLLKEDDLQPVCDLYRWDGQKQGQGPRYGMPHDWSQDSMYWINQATFDAAKVPYPSQEQPLSFDEMLDLGKRLTVHQGSKLKTYGMSTNWDFLAQILTMADQAGASLYVNNDLSKMDFTQPEIRKIIQWFVSWAQARVGDSPLDPSTDWSGPLFISGRMGMVPWGYWFSSYLATSDPKTRKQSLLIPAPQWGTTKRVSNCYGGTGWYIPKKSKHQDEAWKFFEFYMGGDPAVARAKSGTGLSPLKHLFDQIPNATAYDKQAYNVQKAELPYLSTYQFTPYATTQAISQAIDNNIKPVMLGQTSLDSGLQQLNTTINKLLQQGKSQIG
ncbi:extracellular solute-binding protein [Dictyobacter kobayashii]|uniref:Sugar ABC transporter substrate-binding protein n=1 Tax=Dictyobacter kobayashii TaxID=2014872 RepID=A0A402ATA6_9CHLR|nr:extracellular solute-binding protein [Dictyobacter kobayashii]GCE22366.1 hypothetical protein KDK_61660 [Dictyobacter kobayashii]